MRKTFAILMVLAAMTLFTGCGDDSSSGPHPATCMSRCLDKGNTQGVCELLCADKEE